MAQSGILVHMGDALAGLVVASGLYVLGAFVWARMARLSWSVQRGHLPPELQRTRDQASGWNMRSLFHPPQRRTIPWLVLAAVIFALLWVADFGLTFLVVYVAVLSAMLTPNTVAAARRRSRERFTKAGVPAARLEGTTHSVFVLALYLAGWMLWAGTVGTVCFLGGLAAAAIH